MLSKILYFIVLSLNCFQYDAFTDNLFIVFSSRHQLPRAIIAEPEERKAKTMIQQINTMRKEKLRVRKIKDTERRQKYLKKQAKIAEQFAPQKREERKRKFARAGAEEKRKRSKMDAGGRFASS